MKEKISIGYTTKKYIDTSFYVSQGGKLQKYWSKRGFKTYFSGWRKPEMKLLESAFKTDIRTFVVSGYGYKGLEFGNWVTNEDRLNYIAALLFCSYDLRRVLKLGKGKSLGNGVLAVAFGARGSGKALAHFEPHSNTINLTRYKRKDRAGLPRETTKEQIFETIFKGGIGSFAHEFGHFVDFHFGQKVGGSSLTDWSSVRILTDSDIEAQKEPARKLTFELISTLQTNGDKVTDYFERMIREKLTEYWFRHTELFARSFEVYVFEKLKREGIKNNFLTKTKYESFVYPDEKLTKKIVPIFDKIFSIYRQKIK